jgi:hypothetical protein
MTDQLTRITQTKLTQSQKRGFAVAKHSSREYNNDRRNLDPVQPRAEAELRAAQHNLASLALDKDEPAEWLTDVLSALGLHRVISPS